MGIYCVFNYLRAQTGTPRGLTRDRHASRGEHRDREHRPGWSRIGPASTATAPGGYLPQRKPTLSFGLGASQGPAVPPLSRPPLPPRRRRTSCRCGPWRVPGPAVQRRISSNHLAPCLPERQPAHARLGHGPDFESFLEGRVLVCHTSFNRVAINRATERCTSTSIPCAWLDSARVARRTWLDFSCNGYGLESVAAALGINFKHHVAVENARATGEVMVRAMAHSGLTLSEWLIRATQPISLGKGHGIAREGSPDGPLAGEVVVFTGALALPRREAADLAAAAGCTVEESLNKRTTLLIVGDQDIRRLAGHEKSSKQRKAEQLIDKGQAVRILGEGDFRRLVPGALIAPPQGASAGRSPARVGELPSAPRGSAGLVAMPDRCV